MPNPIEYPFTKLAKFVARRNTCEFCNGTGSSWEQVLFLDGGPSREIVFSPCPRCSEQIQEEDNDD